MWCVAWWGACGGPDDRVVGADADSDVDADADTDTDPSGTLRFVGGPVLRANPSAGLSTWVDGELSRDGWLEVRVEVDGREWSVGAEAPSRPSTSPSQLVLGLRPDRDVALTVVGHAADGAHTDPVTLTTHTEPLPESMSRRIVVQAEPSRMEPGVTLLPENDFAVMLDDDGVPCWYVTTQGATQIVDRYSGDRIGLLGSRNRFDLLEPSGAISMRWFTKQFDGPEIPHAHATTATALHHDVIELPDGHFLALSIDAELRDYPTREDQPGPLAPAHVAAEVVVELLPDGTKIDRWALGSLLDPQRIGYDSVYGDYWEEWKFYRRGLFTHDSLHANSLDYDPASDTILVSLRHQDAVVAIGRTSGEVEWIAAPPVNWAAPWADLVLTPPADPASWFYHQHNATFTDRGTVLLFDNGNRRASAYEPPAPPSEVESRALELAVDPVARSWSVVWEWSPGTGDYAGSLGGVQELPVTGNRLVTYGNLTDDDAASRVYEVAPDGTVVWQLDLDVKFGLAWYRARRITGFIPGPGR